jgi:uncharacterized membrane protein
MTGGMRLLAILATVSVAINLLIAGMFVGFRFHDDGPPQGGPPGARGPDANGLPNFLMRAPEPMRPFLRDRVTHSRDELNADVQAVRGARREAFEVLRAQPFDRGRAAEALERLRETSEKQQEHLHDILLDAYEAAPPDVRRMGEERLFLFRRGRGGPDGPRGSGEVPPPPPAPQ